MLTTAVATIAAYLFLVFGSFLQERRLWNKGVSAETGRPWKLSRTSILGERVYTDGVRCIWITYSCVDKVR
jgi:hypothetical protein